MTLVRICKFRYFFALGDFLHYDSPVEIDEPGFPVDEEPVSCL
jgi:hypothetical protein